MPFQTLRDFAIKQSSLTTTSYPIFEVTLVQDWGPSQQAAFAMPAVFAQATSYVRSLALSRLSGMAELARKQESSHALSRSVLQNELVCTLIATGQQGKPLHKAHQEDGAHIVDSAERFSRGRAYIIFAMQCHTGV
jgi:hypothetical protein